MSSFKTGEDYYHKIYLKFNALVAISLVPFGYMVLEMHNGTELDKTGNFYLNWIVAILLIFAGSLILVNGKKRFSNELQVAIDQNSLRQKLTVYLSAANRKFFNFTLAALIFDAGLFLTGSPLLIVAFVIAMILLSLGRPTLKLIVDELRLNKEDQQILRDKKEIY